MGVRRTLFLNSKGLNTKIGALQIKSELNNQGIKDLSDKTIYVVSFPEYEVDDIIRAHCIQLLGLKEENIRFSEWNIPDCDFIPDVVYVGEGNTFEMLHYMRKYGIVDYIKQIWVDNFKNRVYIGSSAGAAIAGVDIMLARDFDSNFVSMYDFSALELLEGAVVPHYTRDELKQYIELTEEHILRRYKTIYSVSNEEVLIIDTKGG